MHDQCSIGIAGPFGLGTVPVEFDAIAVRIAEIECLANAVVTGAVDRDVGGGETLQGVAETRTVRVEQCDVIEPGGAGRGGEPPRLSQVLSPMWW